jgi:hypothetical protein
MGPITKQLIDGVGADGGGVGGVYSDNNFIWEGRDLKHLRPQYGF